MLARLKTQKVGRWGEGRGAGDFSKMGQTYSMFSGFQDI
jgi:hypothetical protein